MLLRIQNQLKAEKKEHLKENFAAEEAKGLESAEEANISLIHFEVNKVLCKNCITLLHEIKGE